MILRLLAPLTIERLRTDPLEVLRDDRGYAAWWTQVAEKAGPELEAIPSVAAPIESVAFCHSDPFVNPGRSDFRRIDVNSLRRPLQVIELVTTTSLRSHLQSASSISRHTEEVRRAVGEQLEALEATVLVRVYDHDVGHVEIEIKLPAPLVELLSGTEQEVAEHLDALQALSVEVGESVAAFAWTDLLRPFSRWLWTVNETDRWLLGAAGAIFSVNPTYPPGQAHWVSRTLVLEGGDYSRSALDSSARDRLVGHWLKDVVHAEQKIESCRADRSNYDLSWVNFLVGEESYATSDLIRAQVDARARTGGPAGLLRHPFHRWDALLIAQFYYAAFDVLQSQISYILAVSVSGAGRIKLDDVKTALDEVVRDANLLLLKFQDDRKYYARPVMEHLDSVLEGFQFEQDLRLVVIDRLASCEGRLQELHSRSVERSSVYTDLILLAIGVSTIFEVLLTLASYGRTTSADPELSVYDRVTWNLADWIGANSTDAVLAAGAVFSIGLTLLYAYFRSSGSRI